MAATGHRFWRGRAVTARGAKLLGPGAALPALALLLSGCSLAQAPVLDPHGPVALAGRELLFSAFKIMLIVVVPVIVLTFWFAWRYRATNARARYEPDWMSARVDTAIWFIPALIVATLGVHSWTSTHALDPYRPLDSLIPPLEVEAIAQDWKWLFVYPGERVAAVNELAFPVDRPLRLKITSDTVMNALSIPALAGQIYAMAGMETQLNLRAFGPGRFAGRNTQYSGDGFPDQHFAALAMSAGDFDAWVARAQASPARLDPAGYTALAVPSSANPVAYYAEVDPGLFHAVMMKYALPIAGHDHAANAATPGE